MRRRLMRCIWVALAIFAAGPVARAQTQAEWELRPFAGYAMPTGAHRADFSNAPMSGAEAAVRLTGSIDLVGSFAWQPSLGRYNVSERYVDVWGYNLGVERSMRSQRL